MIYHTLHTMSINRCNRMLLEEDVRLIARIPAPKLVCVIKHNEFMDQLKEVFNEGEINKVLENNILRMGLVSKINKLTQIALGFDCVNKLKDDNPKAVQLRDQLNKRYRDHFFDYPNRDNVLDVIKSEIKKLEIKEKMFRPKPKKGSGNDKNEGLEPILRYIRILTPDALVDRRNSVYSLKSYYNDAMQKARMLENAK